MKEHGYQRVEALPDAQAHWVDEVRSGYEGSLLSTAKSWFTGYNSNVAGHDKIRYLMYLLGAPKYRDRLNSVANEGYPGFKFG